MVRHDREAETLRDHCQEQGRFDHREGVADAQARPAAEGEVREARQVLQFLFRPALRTELHRLLEPARVAVYDPLAHQDRRAFRHTVASDDAVTEGLAADRVDRRTNPHRFLYHLFGVTQAWQ